MAVAVFANTTYTTMTQLDISTGTSIPFFATSGPAPISFVVRPVGRPLRMPPQEGTWIAEKAVGAKSRKIIEVVCGSHVVCEGKRHSVIAWRNLGRYIEVDPLKSP